MNGVVLGGGLAALLWLLLRKTSTTAATSACKVTGSLPPTAGDLAVFKAGWLALMKSAGTTPGTITVWYDRNVKGIRMSGDYYDGTKKRWLDATDYAPWSDVAKGFKLVDGICSWSLPKTMRVK